MQKVTTVLFTGIEMFTPIVLLDRAKRLLAKAEWSIDGHCPWCDNYQARGHTADCPYAQFIIENTTGLDVITKGDYGGLTEREFEVLTKMAQGMMNDEIALCLEISPQTVKNHISSS